MSRKISDFFKIGPKLNQNQGNLTTVTNIKYEKEENFDINFNEIQQNGTKKWSENIECQVIKQEFDNQKLKDTKTIKNKIKVSFNKPKANSWLKKVKCQYCDQMLPCYIELKHIKSVHPEKLKELSNHCAVCDDKFMTRRSLEQHMTRKHPTESKLRIFECDFDGKIFITKAKLRTHMYYHQMKIKCELCQIEVVPMTMQKHITNIHKNERKFQCKICQKSYKTNFALKDHIKIHNKNFQCQNCSKMFPNLGLLNRHIKEYHENPELYECQICGKKFNRKNHFKQHQMTHNKYRPKPLKCQRCDYATDINRNFIAHQKYHEELDKKFAAMKNPIKCQKCARFCKDKKALSRHLSTVHPKVLYQCDLCGKYLKAKIDMKKHIVMQSCQKMKILRD